MSDQTKMPRPGFIFGGIVPSSACTNPEMWALKTPEQIFEDIRACIKLLTLNESAQRPLPNIVPKSVWLKLSEFERRHYRYPRWEDEPIGSKRRRRERRQDWKHKYVEQSDIISGWV